MKRRLDRTVAAVIFSLLVGLVGCVGIGGPRRVSLSLAQMQRTVERQFPRQHRLLEVIDVSVARPTLRLLPQSNRIATDLDLAATERLSGHVVRGNLSLDYALRYEPSDATLRLTQVHVQAFKLELGNGPLAPSNARLGALLAERLLDDAVLYRPDAERLSLLQRAGISAAAITVTPSGVELQLSQGR